MLASLAAAVASAVVAVPVANVWATPGAGALPADPHAWPTPSLTVAARRALVGRLSTQALYGERVVVLARRGAWTKIAIPDQPSPLDRRGYPGWVESRQLSFSPETGDGRVAVVVTRTAKLRHGPEVSFGTELPLLGRGASRVAVATPHGRDTLPARAVVVSPKPASGAAVVASAEAFLGLRYLWGGVSAWGFDCSGLVWAAYRVHGITIPRDAEAQAVAGRPVGPPYRPGDLLFYGVPHVDHVALYAGGGRMLEAPGSAAPVRLVPVRSAGFAGARRIL